MQIACKTTISFRIPALTIHHGDLPPITLILVTPPTTFTFDVDIYEKSETENEMKKYLVVIIALMFGLTTYAQQETLLTGDIHHGGYGGPALKFTSINGEFGMFVGGRGAYVLNKAFSIGFGGYGLVTDLDYDLAGLTNPDDKPRLVFGYGGLELGAILHSDRVVHFTFTTLIGGGALHYQRDDFWRSDDWDDFWDTVKNNDVVFVIEPEAGVELNVASYMRVNLGVSYRFVTGVDISSLTSSDLDGLTGTLTFKFGAF